MADAGARSAAVLPSRRQHHGSWQQHQQQRQGTRVQGVLLCRGLASSQHSSAAPLLHSVFICANPSSGTASPVPTHKRLARLPLCLSCRQSKQYVKYLSWQRRLEMLRDVSAGLKYLHKAGHSHPGLRSSRLYVSTVGRVRHLAGCGCAMLLVTCKLRPAGSCCLWIGACWCLY